MYNMNVKTTNKNKKLDDFCIFYNYCNNNNNNNKLYKFDYNNPHDKQCLRNTLQNVCIKYKTSHRLVHRNVKIHYLY